MSSPIEIMKNAYLEDYKGSLTELIAQSEMEAIQSTPQPEMDVASTPQQQQTGLTNGSTNPMGFPLEPGANNQFNTVGVPGNIKMTEYANGNPIDSSQILEPGLVGINTHPQTDFVLEEPMYAKTGGEVKNAPKGLSLSQKIERYKKNRYK